MNNPIWYRGALHTHSFASDGEGFPEEIVLRHRERGYDFVAITDHNEVNADANLWMPVLTPEQGPFAGNLPYVGGCSYQAAVERYIASCGSAVELKRTFSAAYVRVKTLAEVCRRYDEPGRFLVLKGEELSHWFSDPGGRRQLHCGALNLAGRVEAPNQLDISATLGADFNRCQEAFRQAGEPGVFVCNHPHGYIFDLEPQLLIDHWQIRHFELVNSNVDGVGGVESMARILPRNNEMFWDIVNSFRLAAGHPALYAAAGDDAHYYDEERIRQRCGVGFAWIMVKIAGEFTRQAIAEAMNRGDYYPSTGVKLAAVDYDRANGRLAVQIEPEPGVEYKIRFVVARRDFNRQLKTLSWSTPDGRYRRALAMPGPGMGVTVKTVAGTTGEYILKPRDLYVRAVAESNRPARCRSHRHPEWQSAWTQPLAAASGRDE